MLRDRPTTTTHFQNTTWLEEQHMASHAVCESVQQQQQTKPFWSIQIRCFIWGSNTGERHVTLNLWGAEPILIPYYMTATEVQTATIFTYLPLTIILLITLAGPTIVSLPKHELWSIIGYHADPIDASNRLMPVYVNIIRWLITWFGTTTQEIKFV